MTIHVHHHHPDLARLEHLLMALSKEVADLQAAVKEAAARAATTAQSFHDQIAALQAQVAAGTLSDEDKAALIEAANLAKGIDPSDPTTVTPPAPNPGS